MKTLPANRKQVNNSGALKNRIIFYSYKPNDGPEPGEEKENKLHTCLCEAYSPSMKDLAIMEVKGTKEAITVRIRDTQGEYIPTNKHFARLDDYRYSDKVFSVVDVRNDLADNRFITVLLGVTS